MARDDELQRIIDRLRQLQLQRRQIATEERRLLRELEDATWDSDDDDGSYATAAETPRAATPAVRVTSPTQATAPTTPAAQQQRPPPVIIPERTSAYDYRIGDLIYITNRITHAPPGRSNSLIFRAATVISLRDARVHFRTFSGTTSWRLPHNVRHLTLDEQHRLGA